jgi:CubicO group peptidase (beta-lactamase class C family)
LFRLGSVSKVITATAAAKLASRGTLDLDLPIATWLDDLPPQHRRTTLRQLLNHQGGVRHYRPEEWDPTKPEGVVFSGTRHTAESALSLFVNDPLVAPPGSRVAYSSYGYTLASRVMELAAGQEFVRLVDQEIAEPFGLPSLLPDDPLAIVPGRASGYMGPLEIDRYYFLVPEAKRPRLTGGWANIPLSHPGFCWAGAGLLMSMPDLACFGAALLDGPEARITAAKRNLLFTAQASMGENGPSLGLGWRLDEDRAGRQRWHHAGATPGSRAGLVVYPAQRLAVALASNVATTMGDVLGPASDLADIFER